MKNDLVQFAAFLLVLIVGAAAEDLLPHFLGVGFPLLLAALLVLAPRLKPMNLIAFAIAAGAMEDALAVLPPSTSISFFLAAAAVSRASLFPRATAVFAYGAYQFWMSVWVRSSEGSLALRMLLAVPIGILTLMVVEALLKALERRAAIEFG